MWVDWGFIIFGILSLSLFVQRRFRKVRILGFGDIILVGFGIWALTLGLYGLFFGTAF